MKPDPENNKNAIDYLLAIIDTSFPGDVGCPARAEAGLQALQQRLQQVARFLLLLLEIETTNAPMLLLAGHAPALLAAIPRVQEHWQPPSLANLEKTKKISLQHPEDPQSSLQLGKDE